MHPLLAVCLAAFLLSLFVEFFQVFQPKRSPSLQDLLMNTIGGAAGYGVFQLWKKYFAEGRIARALFGN